MSNADEVLKITTANKVCLLTLNRPERRNALSKELQAALRGALIAADVDPEVAVVAITGAGTAFCAGVDLAEARALDESGGRYRGPLHEPERSFTEVLVDSRKPSLAIVNGPAMAGGCELALACDLRVAAEHAVFAVPEARRGMGAHGLSRIARCERVSHASRRRYRRCCRSVRGLEPDSPEWAAVAPQLAAKRLNAPGSVDVTVARWAATCQIYRLVPIADPIEAGPNLSDASGAAAPRPTPAATHTPKPFRLHRVRGVD